MSILQYDMVIWLCVSSLIRQNADDYIEYVNQYAPKQSILLEESYYRVFVYMHAQSKAVFILKC